MDRRLQAWASGMRHSIIDLGTECRPRKICYWTDSPNCLFWINSNTSSLKTRSNRVGEIHTCSEEFQKKLLIFWAPRLKKSHRSVSLRLIGSSTHAEPCGTGFRSCSAILFWSAAWQDLNAPTSTTHEQDSTW
jgi:hypothetical protein